MSTKVIGTVAGVGSVAGLLVAIGGIVLVILSVTDKIPTSSCLSNGWGISKELQEAFVFGQFIVGVPFLLGGIFACAGGIIGGWAGFTGNKRGLSCTAWAEGLAFVFALLGAILAWKLAARFGELCGNFECGASCADQWQECVKENVCCDCRSEAGKALAMCKSAHDWACDCESRKTGGLVLSVVTCIFTIVGSTCGCGATCCCPDSFEYAQLAPTGESGEYGGEVEGTVVGKVVS